MVWLELSGTAEPVPMRIMSCDVGKVLLQLIQATVTGHCGICLQNNLFLHRAVSGSDYVRHADFGNWAREGSFHHRLVRRKPIPVANNLPQTMAPGIYTAAAAIRVHSVMGAQTAAGPFNLTQFYELSGGENTNRSA